MKEKQIIRGKKNLAKLMGISTQSVTALLKEGRIKNYGRGRIYLFDLYQACDLRRVKEEK